MNTTATWTPLYWQPVMGSGERIMAGAIVEYEGEITAHRLIRDDVLKSLYGSSAKDTQKLLDTALDLQCQIAKITGLSELPELMGLYSGVTHTTNARSRLEALRHAVMLYSSLCNLDVLDDLDDDEKPVVNDANKRFITEVRESTALIRPELLNFFNKQSPLFGGGEPVKFGYLSQSIIVHFTVLHPTKPSQSVREARAKLWELSGARDYIGINAAMIMAVPREDDATLGTQQAAIAQKNRDEIEREADEKKMRLYHVYNATEGAEKLVSLPA
jgi:hypothetical protein